MNSPRTAVRQYWVAIRAMLVFTAVLGIGYTALITGIGQLALPWQSNGSTIVSHGHTVGSALIGQAFTDKKGNALPEWFQSRPSAAIAKLDGVPESQVPADAVTASASGLDPHISPEFALEQVDRVAAVRGLPESRVRSLVEAQIQGPDAGFLGQSRVNVLELNLALAALKG
jgi:K+-transporting ATPase ATPase C chain